MARFIFFCVFCIGLIGVAERCEAQGGNEKTIVLSGDPWPPYFLGEVGGYAESGLGLEILDAIASHLGGIKFKVSLLPWKRALQAARVGDVDGISFLHKTSEREDYLAFTDPVFSSGALIWYSKARFPDGFTWQTIDDLGSFVIGINRGYSYGPDIDSAIAERRLNVMNAKSVEHLFALLDDDRIDLVVANDQVGFSILRTNKYLNEIEFAEKPTGTDVYHLGLSKKSKYHLIIPELNRVIQMIKDEKIIEEILSLNGNRNSK